MRNGVRLLGGRIGTLWFLTRVSGAAGNNSEFPRFRDRTHLPLAPKAGKRDDWATISKTQPIR
jgi:hypothetical protein